MRVLERFARYESDPTFRSVFEDAELIGLSERIFGHIPGTEDLGPTLGRAPCRCAPVPVHESRVTSV
jgi:hypothetical protein